MVRQAGGGVRYLIRMLKVFEEALDQEDRLDRLSREWAERRSDMDITPWQVWGRITRINDIFLSELNELLTQHGLNYTELQILAALIVSGPPYESKPNAISRHYLLTSGGLTNALTRMEKKGLVTRRKDPQDRRGVIVTVTQSGLDKFNAIIVKENAIEHRLLGGISKEEQAVVSTILRKILLQIDRGQ